MTGTSRRVAALATAVAALTTFAACGSGASRGSTNTTDSVDQSASTTTFARSPDDIVIGLANTEGQAVSVPQLRYGAEAAVVYINERGGINGHHVRLVKCVNDGSPDGSVNCANQFVSAHAVAYFAGVDAGADAALPVVSAAGIPYVSWVPWGQVVGSSPDAVALDAGISSFVFASLHELKQSGAKKVAFFVYDLPQAQQIFAVLQGLASNIGIDVVPVKVAAANADWASAAATAQADGVDAMWGLLQDGDCTNMIRAVRGAGYDGPIAVGSCMTYIATLGNDATNTIAAWPSYLPDLKSIAPVSIQSDLDTYVKYMTAAGHGADVNGSATATFASMVELAEVMKGIAGKVTPANLLRALRTAKVRGFMGPAVDCTRTYFPFEKSVCNSKVLVFKVVSGPGGPVRQLMQPGYLDTSPSQ